MGEVRIPSTETTGSGGYEISNGVTEVVGGSGGYEISNGVTATGGENGLPLAGIGETNPIRKMGCVAIDNFNDFEPQECDDGIASGKTVLDERRWPPIGEDSYQDSYLWGPPLVANLTDDYEDGRVDLCDYPDILIMADLGPYIPLLPLPVIRLINGKDNTLHDLVFGIPVDPGTTPAIGDIDRDGSPDIVAASRTNIAREVFEKIIAFNRDGTVKWQKQTNESPLIKVETIAITLADLDSKREGVEVIAGFNVFDGRSGDPIVTEADMVKKFFGYIFDVLYVLGPFFEFKGVLRVAPTAADLDDDGDLEVVIGPIAFRPNGDVYYEDQSDFSINAAWASAISSASGAEEDAIYNIYPLVANLDDDDQPEVLYTAASLVYILENDGRVKKELDLSASGIKKLGPATVNDFDGDGKADIAFDTSLGLRVYDRNLERILYRIDTQEGDPGCVTSFDFRGDGAAEVIYSDGQYIRVLDLRTKEAVASLERKGSKGCAVVADVDVDDGKRAEIVFVDERTVDGDPPSVRIIREHNNRWVPTRRIWNEYNYHVTNVLEDGRIPSYQPPYLEQLHAFRANVQVQSDGFCIPIVE